MFDPNEHLITLQGKSYLPVAPRLVWLREQQPDAIITTEIIEHNAAEKWVIVRATVTLASGGSATGMAYQAPTAIAKDYIANCETSAIGRALAALGYGTQHAVELDQGDQVVDAPVERRSSAAANAPIAPLQASNLAPAPTRDPDRASTAQLAKIHATAPKNGWTPEAMRETCLALWGFASSADLSKYQASLLIDLIEDRLHMVTAADGVTRLVKAGGAEPQMVVEALSAAMK